MSPTQQQLNNKARKRRPLSGQRKSKKTVSVGANTAWQLPAVCFALAAITVAIYSPVAGYPFINYDDPDYVSRNAHVQAGLSWRTLTWAMTSGFSSNWHPLTWLSHALDYQLFGLNAGGHHVSNLLLHALNVVLLFLLMARATGAVGRSALAASFFALHPFNVGSVIWISERKNLLSTLFFLLALGAYGWYARRPGWRRYVVVALVFALGLASKPMVITLPLILFLLDYWPLGRIAHWTEPSATFPVPQFPWTRLALEKLPLLLLSVASAVITVVVQSAAHAVESLGAVPLVYRLENAVYSYAMYLVKTFWPSNFAPIYPHPLNTLSFAQVALPVILLVGLSILVWKLRTGHGYALVGWLWFLGTLVPVIGIMQVGAQGMADRYAYLPLIGIFVAVVWGFADLGQARSWNWRLGAAVAIAIVCALSVITWQQIRYWRGTRDLWQHTLDVTQNNFVAYDNMGEFLLHEGRMEALGYFESAARIAPWDPVSHAAVAGSLQDRGRYQDAIREYTIALRAQPDDAFRAHIYTELGVLYRQIGDYAQARENSHLALSLDPQQVQELLEELTDRVAQHPAPSGYWQLGLMLEGTDQTELARSAFQKALRLNPDFAPAREALEVLAKEQ